MISVTNVSEKGPAKIIQYQPREILRYFNTVRHTSGKKELILEGPVIGIGVDGLLDAAATAALLCREQNLPMSKTYFSLTERRVYINYVDPTLDKAYEELAQWILGVDVRHRKTDRWGNDLFEAGGAVT